MYMKLYMYMYTTYVGSCEIHGPALTLNPGNRDERVAISYQAQRGSRPIIVGLSSEQGYIK